jgi:undecaprenyl-diphosphatase
MDVLDAIILGAIQGLTEFLPVSSSGHLELGKVVLGLETEVGLLFSIFLHAATALSTLVVFRKDIADILKGLLAFRWNESYQFVLLIVISIIPLVPYVFFKKEIEPFFEGRILWVGCFLLLTGSLLLLTHYFGNKEGKEVGPLQAFIIGIAQAIAVLPGISRSGATIATGLLLGVDKSKVARFSFLMVLPPILGAALLELKDYLEEPAAHAAIGTAPLIAGFIAAFVVGFAACTWMIGIVKKGKLSYFAYYCFLVGAIAIGFGLFAA